MANFNVETKNKIDVEKKPRVYFCCHPDDFEKHFKRICNDIFKTHDCAICYIPDMNEEIEEDSKDIFLGRFNLFVVPVTFSLLSVPNRAMDKDIPYALENHIPVLPIMMEPGLDMLYSEKTKFGELQYLNPTSSDLTEISYQEKLKNFLESVLISDKLAGRIREAFDDYIFLSYRKKDRKHANNLMRLIHSNPELRDIAIWFDEFITPGENFRENISKVLKDSRLFALLVTPNLLEMPEGKPNFVMEQEYPAAKELGLEILPAEMENTDKNSLNKSFANLPLCLNPDDDEFRLRLLGIFGNDAIESDDTPEHKYLIGLAYLEGIDVEVDRERGIELITSAANDGLFEAMDKLYEMYLTGTRTDVDYQKVVHWAEVITSALLLHEGEKHTDTMSAMNKLSVAYIKNGEIEKALKVVEALHEAGTCVYGKNHPQIIRNLTNLATIHAELGHEEKALRLMEEAYSVSCSIHGEESYDSILILNNISSVYYDMKDYEKSVEIMEKAHGLAVSFLGENHPDTLKLINNYSKLLEEMGNFKRAIEYFEKVYSISCELSGELHPDSITYLTNLACAYCKTKEYFKAAELMEKACMQRIKILGENHPDSVLSFSTFAGILSESDKKELAVGQWEKALNMAVKVFGSENEATINIMDSYATDLKKLGRHRDSLDLKEKIYKAKRKLLGDEHPATLKAMNNLAYTYNMLGYTKKSLEMQERVYKLQCKILGENHPGTLNSLNNLAGVYSESGKHQKAFELLEKLYRVHVFLSDADEAEMQNLLQGLVTLSKKLKNKKKEEIYGAELAKTIKLPR